MSRFDWLRRVRSRSTEEQMLATMLVAGVVFAIVALVAFLRPGGQSAASVHGPQVRTAQTNGDANAPQGSSTHVAIDQGITPDAPAPASDAQTITEKLQRLFGAVVTPLGFTTDLPPLIKTATPVSVSTSNPNTFPTTFPSLPGKLPPPPPTLPPPPPTLPPTTDTLPPPTTATTVPPTTVTTLPPTTVPTLPPTTPPPTTQPPTTDTTLPPSTDTTLPPTTDTTQPPTTDTTQPVTTSSSATTSTGLLPGVPLP